MSKLFTPLTIRGLEISNRAWVSPMCQYSATDGVVGEWHRIHIGALATGKPGLIVMEATGVVPEGRISIDCPGLWNDQQEQALKPLIAFAHSLNVKMGIQLAHAGRKASMYGFRGGHKPLPIAEGGWQAVAPSPIAFHGYEVPRELTREEIASLVKAWGAAARRAVSAGFDFVEIHAAHGYLLHEFLSPLSNHRSDEYGGSLENRMRFLVDVASEVRASIPNQMPLFVRISATDWAEEGFNEHEAVEVSRALAQAGVDLIDVSSGGLVHNAKVEVGPGYQVKFASDIKKKVKVLVSAVGMITTPEQAEEILQSDSADAIMMGREFLRNPRWPLLAARTLGDELAWPSPIARG